MRTRVFSRYSDQDTMAQAPTNEEVLAQGLINLLGPVVQECDANIQEVVASQRDLASQIDILSKGTTPFHNAFSIPPELEIFMGVSKTPLLTPYVQKLQTARQRMDHINSMLATINARLDRIQKNAS